MESFLNRYRNITVLLLVIFAQLVLLAYQVKNDHDVRFIRVWAVTLVSPFARLVEGLRGNGFSFVRNYITLHDADAENRRLKAENDKLKLDLIFLNNQLNTADRAQALQLFQRRTQSKTLPASVFSMGIPSSRKVLYVDRGSLQGVMREMAVITADGIVGKVTNVYPTLSEVLLVTDPQFAAGVMSGKAHAHGNLIGTGTPLCKVDFVAFEDKVEPGDWFYTSGDDRIFPRGMPVGVVKSVKAAQPYKEITLEPSGLSHGSLEDVLIVLEGVHQEIPDNPPANQPVYMGTPPPAPAPADGAATAAAGSGTPGGAPGTAPATGRSTPGTEADKMYTQYQKAADNAGVVLGGGPTGQIRTQKPPDFTNLPVDPRTVNQGRGAPPNGPKPAAGQPALAPAPVEKKSTAPAEKKGTGPDKTTPDAIRRANQAGGGGPGGIPQL